MGTKLARNLLEAAVEPRSPGHPHLCSRYAFKSRSLFSALFFVHDFLFTSQWYVTSLQTSTPCLLGAEGIRKDLDVQSLLLCPPAHRVNVVDPWNMTRSYWRAVDLWAGRWGDKQMHQKNSELPSFHVSLVVFLHQVLEDVHKGHRLVDNVLSKCLRWGYLPSCTNNQFCNASDISMPFLPLFPCSFWMWCCGLMCPGSYMMPSCELVSKGTLTTTPSFPSLIASPCWQVCHYLTSNTLPRPGFTAQQLQILFLF